MTPDAALAVASRSRGRSTRGWPARGHRRTRHAGPATLRVVIGLEGLALGGCPINALDLARALTARGHVVTVCAVEEDVKVSILPRASRLGIPITLIPRADEVRERATHYRRLVEAHRADVLHVFAPWLGPAAWLATARSTCVALTTNWMMENEFYLPRDMPVILGTRQLQEELSVRHRAPVWLLEPPVDLDSDRPDPAARVAFRRQWEIREAETAVVIVSRVDSDLKAEGIGHAIRAVERLDDPDLRLVIVGDGDSFEDISALVTGVNTRLRRPAIVLTGAMIDPRPAYNAADVMLGMGGSAIRSLAHAKPLVVLGLGGFARLFEPKTAGYFYTHGFFGEGSPADPVAHLADLIDPLRSLPGRAGLGEFGLAHVERRFGLQTQARSLEAMYRTAVGPAYPGLLTRMRGAARIVLGHHARGLRNRLSTKEGRSPAARGGGAPTTHGAGQPGYLPCPGGAHADPDHQTLRGHT